MSVCCVLSESIALQSLHRMGRKEPVSLLVITNGRPPGSPVPLCLFFPTISVNEPPHTTVRKSGIESKRAERISQQNTSKQKEKKFLITIPYNFDCTYYIPVQRPLPLTIFSTARLSWANLPSNSSPIVEQSFSYSE